MPHRASEPQTPRQRSPRTDPDLRDGDSGHGNPGELAGWSALLTPAGARS